MQIVPNSWGTALREFNPHHEPAGSPRGGRFARRAGGPDPVVSAYLDTAREQSQLDHVWGASGEVPAKSAEEAATRLHALSMEADAALQPLQEATKEDDQKYARLLRERLHAEAEMADHDLIRPDAEAKGVPEAEWPALVGYPKGTPMVGYPGQVNPRRLYPKPLMDATLAAEAAVDEQRKATDAKWGAYVTTWSQYTARARDILRVEHPATGVSILNQVQTTGPMAGVKGQETVGQALADRGMNAFRNLVSAEVGSNIGVWVRPVNGHRAYFDESDRLGAGGIGTIAIAGDRSPRVYVHEMGHALEAANRSVLAASVAFRDRRTAGEPVQRLTELSPAYGPDEMAQPDKFLNPYIGKWYRAKGNEFARAIQGRDGNYHTATEVVSNGLEMMFSDPLRIARDPDYLAFMFNVTRGRS